MTTYLKGTSVSWTRSTHSSVYIDKMNKIRELDDRYAKHPCFQAKDGKVIWIGYAQKVAIGKKNEIKIFLHTVKGELDAHETIHYGKAKQ